MSDDLAAIFIRAKVDDRWGSFSLRQLLDLGAGGQIGVWFFDRIAHLVDYQEGQKLTEHHARSMVLLLETFSTIHRLREIAEDRP